MEITCRRCQTEYEFDDALVSTRGTTVRCTNCGEQFKIYRPDSASGAPERWVVHRRDGRELVFTNLRDLQKAITNLQVGRYDELTRGSGPPRALGAIAELEPFFVGRIGHTPSALPQAAGVARPTAAGPGSPPPRESTEPGVAPPSDPFAPRTGRTGRPPPDGPGAPPPAVPPPGMLRQQAPRAPNGDSAPWAEGPMAPAMLDRGAAAPPPSDEEYDRVMAEAEAAAARLGGGRAKYDPTPNDARISYSPEDEWFDEPRFTASPIRSRALKWLVVLIVLGLVGMVAATVGHKYVDDARSYLAKVSRPETKNEAVDAKISGALDEGEKALLEGDLETAREDFDKASVLSDKDPRALIDLARLGAARADVDWLRVRLIAPDQNVVLSTAKRQLADSLGRAAKATDRAAEVSPDDPRVARLKIDALRLSGDLPAARMLVPRVSSISSQPETAYVLAALDLAEETPAWPAVVDRLKTAAAGEQGLMRARGALVYALIRSGDPLLAKSELEKIIGAPHPYPLLAELRAFLPKGALGADAGGAAALDIDAGKRALAVATGPRPEEAPQVAAGEDLGGDYRFLLSQGQRALGGGQYDRADQLYHAALAKSPGDTEALAGLGDVARARGMRDQARSYYEKVIAQNPHYLPALGALADLRWEAGDHAGATKLYRDVADTTQSGALAERAKERIAQFESSGSKPASPTPHPPTAHPTPSPTPSPPSDLPPGVDTSDLPGFQR